MVPGIPGEWTKIGEYKPRNGEQDNMGTGNKKGVYSENSSVFGKIGNVPPILGNPVPQEDATKLWW